jgi:carboxyl-terminal processing protease
VSAEKGLTDADLQLIDETVALIRTYSLAVPKSTPAMADDILRSYIRSFDQYGDFLTRKQYQAFLESNNADYFGVEMDIEKKNDHIYLYPFKNGMAEKHGIRAGDELIAVNGAPVYGKSIFLVGSTIRGAEGAPVQLTIRSGQGIPRIFSLRRENTSYVSVHFKNFASADYVRITRFTKNTATLLQDILEHSVGMSNILIIDLRQNQGGSLPAAKQCADFFVPSGAILFRLKGRNSVKEILAQSIPLCTGKVIVLQNRYTASAAEVFTAALVENGKAVSAGEQSFGKGLAQRFLSLTTGAALRLTYAEILTPGNHAYNGKGLMPEVVLSRDVLQDNFDNRQSIQRILDEVDMKKSF